MTIRELAIAFVVALLGAIIVVGIFLGAGTIFCEYLGGNMWHSGCM